MEVPGKILDHRLNFEDIDTPEQELAFEGLLLRVGRPNTQLGRAREALQCDAEADGSNREL